jgi:hypothetical protein
MNNGVVAYYSGRQSTVALCTAIAETIALAKLVVKVTRKHIILYVQHIIPLYISPLMSI